MSVQDIVTSAMILLGAGMMALSIFRTRQILAILRNYPVARYWRILAFLMAFFLIGYLAVIGVILAGQQSLILVLTGVVFLFGAVFVYIVVRLGDVTIGDLDRLVAERTAQLTVQTDNLEMSNRRLVLLNRVLSALSVARRADDLLTIVCNELATAFDASRVTAALFNDTHTQVTVIAERVLPGYPASQSRIIPVAGNAVLQDVLTRRQARVIPDARAGSCLAGAHDEVGVSTASLLIVPLVGVGSAIGVICLDAGRPREFTPDEVSLADSVAATVSQSLQSFVGEPR
jgi:hypothetical protein